MSELNWDQSKESYSERIALFLNANCESTQRKWYVTQVKHCLDRTSGLTLPPIRTKSKRKTCPVQPYKRRVKYDKEGLEFNWQVWFGRSKMFSSKQALSKVPLMYYQNSDLLVHSILYYQKKSRRTRSGNIGSRRLSPTCDRPWNWGTSLMSFSPVSSLSKCKICK